MKKEKQVINHLRLLQSVQPDKNTLLLIRSKIPSQIEKSKSFSFKKWFTVTPFVSAISFIIVFVIFWGMINLFPNIFTNTLVKFQIIFASDHYEKAKIALTNVHNQLFELKRNSSDNSKITLLSQSLSLADSEMAGLQLKGEKGKYTSYQCEELYESYHNNLALIENTLSLNKSNDATLLVLQAKQYDKKAEKKLENYNEKIWNDNENR